MTTTNTPVREATAPELEKYRADGQSSVFGLVIQHPATVYTARINQTFTTLDGVAQITYDGGAGTLANVLEGMTMYIGSSAGARDKGEVRIRKTPTSTIFYIGETSTIQFSDNDYLTVVDSFYIWPRLIRNQGGFIQMDYDIDHGSLTRGGAIVRAGPMVAVVEKTTGTLTFTPPNPSLSAVYDAEEISSYLFAAPGSTGTSNMTNPATASWTYALTANQEYRWSVKATDDLGRETTAYRRVFVNPTEIPFALNAMPMGDFDSGNWSFEVTVYSNPGTIYDRALCTLYVRDYHGGDLDTIGKMTGYENIIATGWIDGESIQQDSQTGWVTFTVHGAAYWMEKTNIDPLELVDLLENEFIVPTAWNQIGNMTVDKALARVLYWLTTAPLLMDLFFTGDTKNIRAIPVAGGSLLSQLQAIAGLIFARPLVNNYNQMFIEVDTQLADSDTQDDLIVVLDITTADYERPLEIDKTSSTRTAMLQLSALQDADGVTDIFLYSRAPGNAPEALGVISNYDNYTVLDSAEARRIAGQLFAMENNPYDPITIVFPSSIRLFDIAPRMYATITTDGSDNPRGIALTNQRLIPRRVSYILQNGSPKTVVTFEVGITGIDGIDYFPPTLQDENLDDGLEEFTGVDFPVDDFFPETVPNDVTTPCDRDMGNYFSLTFAPRILTGSTTELIAKAYFPCKVRATGGTAGDTYIELQYNAFGDAETEKAAYAFLGDTRVLTGTWVGNRITFSPVSDTEIDGFEIELNDGAGAVISRWAVGKLVETGDMGETTSVCEDGKYYAIEAYVGHWIATFPAEVVDKDFYNTKLSPSNGSYEAGVGRDGFGVFHLDLSSSFGEYVEPAGFDNTFNPDTQEFEISGNYGRIYFHSGEAPGGTQGDGFQAKIIFSDTLTLGAAYVGMKWALYEAQAIGRQLIIGAATLHNVCALDA